MKMRVTVHCSGMMMITMVIVHEGMTALVMKQRWWPWWFIKDWMVELNIDIDVDAIVNLFLIFQNFSLFNLFQLATDTSLGSESTWLAWTEPPTPLPTFHGELIHHVNIIHQYEFNIPPQNIVTQVHIWAQSLSIVGLSDKSSHWRNFKASLLLFEVMMMDMLLMIRMVALVNMKKQGLTLFPLIQCGWINIRIIGSVKQFVVGSWLWNYLNLWTFMSEPWKHENI